MSIYSFLTPAALAPSQCKERVRNLLENPNSGTIAQAGSSWDKRSDVIACGWVHFQVE